MAALAALAALLWPRLDDGGAAFCTVKWGLLDPGVVVDYLGDRRR